MKTISNEGVGRIDISEGESTHRLSEQTEAQWRTPAREGRLRKAGGGGKKITRGKASLETIARDTFKEALRHQTIRKESGDLWWVYP